MKRRIALREYDNAYNMAASPGFLMVLCTGCGLTCVSAGSKLLKTKPYRLLHSSSNVQHKKASVHRENPVRRLFCINQSKKLDKQSKKMHDIIRK